RRGEHGDQRDREPQPAERRRRVARRVAEASLRGGDLVAQLAAQALRDRRYSRCLINRRAELAVVLERLKPCGGRPIRLEAGGEAGGEVRCREDTLDRREVRWVGGVVAPVDQREAEVSLRAREQDVRGGQGFDRVRALVLRGRERVLLARHTDECPYGNPD